MSFSQMLQFFSQVLTHPLQKNKNCSGPSFYGKLDVFSNGTDDAVVIYRSQSINMNLCLLINDGSKKNVGFNALQLRK